MTPDLRTRVITASILAAAVLLLGAVGALGPSGRWLYAAAAFLVVGLCSAEFAIFSSESTSWTARQTVYALLTLFPALAAFWGFSGLDFRDHQRLLLNGLFLPLGGYAAAQTAALLYFAAAGRNSLAEAILLARELFVGIFLIGFCGALLLSLTVLVDSPWQLLWLLFVVCFNDIAAYFTGKRIGGARLAPALSPKKTISGSLGGLTAAACTGALFSGMLGAGCTYLGAALLALAAAAAAQAGDLTKSYLKRLYSVKDSGALLPGHGGVLDRVDGILLAAPTLYIWIIWLKL